MNKYTKYFVLILFYPTIILNCTSIQNQNAYTLKVDSLSMPITQLAPQLGTIIDSRDGQMYTTVNIGKQIWMAENLRYKTAGSWVNPNNPSPKYGRLYNRITVLTACPEGWHLPSDSEWNILEMNLGMSENEAYQSDWRGKHAIAMKSDTGWAEGFNGDNSSGFNALPAGYYDSESFGGLGNSSGFWAGGQTFNSLHSNDNSGLWVRFLGAPKQGINRFYDDNKNAINWGIACRCVKD